MTISLLAKFKEGLKKSSLQLTSLFSGSDMTENDWNLIEEKLILSDIGAPLAVKLVKKLKKAGVKDSQSLNAELKQEMLAIFAKSAPKKAVKFSNPEVIVVIGVNGAGKTTTIAKLTNLMTSNGKKVLFAAADTYRAAAIEQLQTWAKRLNVPVVSQGESSDPAAVTYDAIKSAQAKAFDVVVVDTAGRLHTNSNLMKELVKIVSVSEKTAGGKANVVLVIDGSAGQNALAQAVAFNDAVPVTSLVITKLDGTAKGGIVLRIADELKLPVSYVGLGESVENLVQFDPELYVEALINN